MKHTAKYRERRRLAKKRRKMRDINRRLDAFGAMFRASQKDLPAEVMAVLTENLSELY